MKGSVTAVGLGEVRLTMAEGERLVCYGLGSCVGVALYERRIHLGALVHVVLPDSQLHRGGDPPPGRYANEAVPWVVKQMEKMGAVRSRIVARMAGGAHVLRFPPGEANGLLDIGTRNVEAVRRALALERIPLAAEDTGGTYGRTIQIRIGSERLLVSTVGRGEREL
jgi:chemotaxis protein CheD